MQNVIQFFVMINEMLLSTVQTVIPQATSLHIDIAAAVIVVCFIVLLFEMVTTRKTNATIAKLKLISVSDAQRNTDAELKARYYEEIEERSVDYKKQYNAGVKAGRTESENAAKLLHRELAIFRATETIALQENNNCTYSDAKAQAETIIDNMKIGL